MRLAICSCSWRCCLTLMSPSYPRGHASAPCHIQATSHPRDMSVFGYGGQRNAQKRNTASATLPERGSSRHLACSQRQPSQAGSWSAYPLNL